MTNPVIPPPSTQPATQQDERSIMESKTVIGHLIRLKNRLQSAETELNHLLNKLIRESGDDWYREYWDYKDTGAKLFLQLDHLLNQIYDTFVEEQHSS